MNHIVTDDNKSDFEFEMTIRRIDGMTFKSPIICTTRTDSRRATVAMYHEELDHLVGLATTTPELIKEATITSEQVQST